MTETAFEGKARIALHDILVATKKNWGAFSKAASQMGVTPEQALASLLARAAGEIRDDTGPDEEKIADYLKTCFVLHAAGLLPGATEARLAGLPGLEDWKDVAAAALGVDAQFVRAVQEACAGVMGPGQVVRFVLRGLGAVPSTDALAHAARP